MTNLYLICALAGGTLFIVQFLLTLIGIGDHGDVSFNHDSGFDHDGAAFWSFVGFRAVVAAVTVFGLAGMAARSTSAAAPFSPLIAVASGVVMLVVVGFAMRGLNRLNTDGTSDIQNARGALGTVYIPIPAANQGLGKVQIDVQNRTLEAQAVTFADALETGTKIVVVDIVSPDTVEVIAVSQMRNPHVA